MIRKQKPSGFFGSNLASYLTLLGCDSLVVTGTTTSGCVRATVVDAFSLNYRVILAEEGCFDRSEASHAVSLCDMPPNMPMSFRPPRCSAISIRCPPGSLICPPALHPPRRSKPPPSNRLD